MPRIRTIKPEFPQSESIGRISRDARLLFIQLWTVVDDSGRARAASRMLASVLYPYDEDAAKLIGKWLAELERENLIRRYEAEGSAYLEIINWLKHQKIDRPTPSRLPAFVESSSSPREPSTSDRRALAADLDLGRDKETDSCAVAKATRPNDDQFEEFWKAYPKRDGANPKNPARKLFLAALKAGTEAREILAGVRGFAIKERDRIGTPYIAQAQKWLRGRCWEDYQTAAASATGSAKGWRPGLPTSAELEAKYANQGVRLEPSPPLVQSGNGIRAAERGMVRGEGGQPRTFSLENLLRPNRMDPSDVPLDRTGR